MAEQKFFAPLAVQPVDDAELDDEELDDVEIMPGVHVSRNILEAPAEDSREILAEVKPLVKQAMKLVTRDDYNPRVEVNKAGYAFAALYDGDLTGDDIEPNNSRITRFYKNLSRGDEYALQQLFMMAIEYGYNLAQQQAANDGKAKGQE